MVSLRVKVLKSLLCLLHLFLGINGLIGGTLLVLKPDGSLLGMQKDWLQHSPFGNYIIPGLLLAFFLGVVPLLTFIGLITNSKWEFPNILNIYRDKQWTWAFSLYTGITGIFWITIQLILTQYFWIQPVIIFISLFILIICLVPYMMEYFDIDN
jgi:hypothetical protein